MKRVPGWVIWLVGLFVVAVGLGLLLHPDPASDVGGLPTQRIIGLAALGAGIVGVLGGAVLKRTSVALLLTVPASLLYVIVYASSLASHAAEHWNASRHSASFEEWHGETTALLAILAWFPALFAMFIGTIVGVLIGGALRSWKGEAALIEEHREDYARRQAGEDVTPGGAPQ